MALFWSFHRRYRAADRIHCWKGRGLPHTGNHCDERPGSRRNHQLSCGALGQSFESAILGQTLIGLGQAGIDISRLLVVLDFASAGGVDRYMGLFMTLYGVRVLLGGILGAGIMQLSPTGSRTALAVACLVVLSGAVSMAISNRRPLHRNGPPSVRFVEEHLAPALL